MNDPAAFWSMVWIPPEEPGKRNRCWLWQGAVDSSGHGAVRWNGRMRGAHRVAVELVTGRQLPRNRHVLHACDVRRCVRYTGDPETDHLSVGSHRDNMRDMRDKHRGRQQRRGSDGSYIPSGRRYW